MAISKRLLAAGVAALAPAVSANLYTVALPEATTTLNIPLDALLDIPVPTRAPSEALVRRQTNRNTGTSIIVAPDNTRGYIDGRPGAPFSCMDDDFTCMFFTADETRYGNVACCNTETCGARATCLGYDDISSASLCDSGCMLDVYTLKCTNAAQPYCNTISFSSDILDFWCNAFPDTVTQVASFTYSGQTGRTLATIDLDDLEGDETTLLSEVISAHESQTNTGPAEPTPTDGGDGDGDGDADSDNSSDGDKDSSNDGSSSGGGGSSTPIGAIVGGVLGGVALLAAIGFGVWFCMRRKKQQQQQQGAPPPVQQVPPPQGPYSPGHGGPPMMAAAGAMSPQPHQGHQSYYDPGFDPSKGPYVQQDFQGTPPPGYPPQMHQQQNLAPGGYYPASTTVPDRNSTVSPSAVSGSGASTHRMSNVPTPNTPASHASQQFGGYAPPPVQQQPGQPTIHEAPGINDGHHRGQMHEMA